MLVSFVQRIKAILPMLSTLPGIVILVKAEQPLKALGPMTVKLLGRLIFVNPEHPKNAPLSMLVTPFPIATLVKLSQL